MIGVNFLWKWTVPYTTTFKIYYDPILSRYKENQDVTGVRITELVAQWLRVPGSNPR
jgi:hypothetical protein